jgi:carboxyl-terminal processing protease
VRAVLDGSPAARAGLARGDRLRACAGEPFRPVRSFVGRAGAPTGLTIVRPDGRAGEVVVVPDAMRPRERWLAATRASARVLTSGGRRLATVHAWSWAGAEMHAALRALLLDGPLAAADGLVLDLRDGLGGADPDAITLFAREVPALEWRDRRGRRSVHASAWRKPVVLLVDGHTTSGKEVLAHAFQRSRRGPVVGTRTSGAVLGGSLFLLADGSVLYLAVRDVRVDGTRLEGRGVEPDVRVEPDGKRGADAMLERALETLLRELGPRHATSGAHSG